MSRNFLKSSSIITIQISRNQGLNEKEMITCSQMQMLYTPTCGFFLKFSYLTQF